MSVRSSIAISTLMLLFTLSSAAVANSNDDSGTGTLEEFDSTVSELLEEWQIPGAQIALMYNGSLVFNKGYGVAANGTDENGTYWSSEVTLDSKFRIASLSKAITAAGILTLVEEGTISLDDSMVDLAPHLLPAEIEGCDYPNHSTAYSIEDINVSLLLNHRAGFDRDGNPNSDPTYWHWNSWTGSWQNDDCIDKQSLIYEHDNGNRAPIIMERVLSEWLRRPLDFDPGSRYVYSNIGYQILGQIIEAQTGMDYEDYIIENVLTPMGIDSMSIGMTLPHQRAEGEVSYFDQGTGWCHFPSGEDENGDPIFPISPDPYCGAFVLEEKDGGGGWIATASDYAKFISHIDGTIQSEVFQDSFEYFTWNPYDQSGSWYGSGIYVLNADPDVWQHWGAFSGTSTNFRREVTDSGEPVVVVMFTNTRPPSDDGDPTTPTWKQDRESTLAEAMMAVDYSNTIPLEQDPVWSWPDPLSEQSQDIMGEAHLDIQGVIRESSDIIASWNASISIRDDYGIDLLPDMDLGVRYQIDQHLGDGDGMLSIPEIAEFVTLVENARNLTDSELLGCCMIDYSPMQADNGANVTVTPPASGPVGSNGSWGWSETSQLEGMTDSRTTRILDIPRVGGVIEEVPLRVTLPGYWELRYSAMLEIIDGSPRDFTIHRQDAPVASDIRISLGMNSAPNANAERETGISTIPLDTPTRYSGECTDSVLDITTQWWTLHSNGTMMLTTHSDILEFKASEYNFTHGEVATVVMHCMDSFSFSNNWNEDIVIDGIEPTWDAVFQVNIDGVVNDLDSGLVTIEIPSGSHFYFSFEASDEGDLPVSIEVTSNKSQGWVHAGESSLEFADHFYQSEQVNGMHLNVTERHKAKDPSEYSLTLHVTDDASNTATHEWTIAISDGFGPTIIPEITSNGTSVSPDSPARAGEEILLSLTESFDDLDAIGDVIWEVSVDEEVIADAASWGDVEKLLLPLHEPGTYLIHIIAWDSAGNMEEISFGLSVSPGRGIHPSVLDHSVIGELVEGESVKIIVNMQNTGGDIGSGVLCSQDACSGNFPISAAEPTGPGVFSAELNLDLTSTSPIELRFVWTSDSAGSEGVLEIENDYVVVSQWQMPLQVLLGVLTLLMLLAWLAHRAWGQDSQRP